MFMILNSPVFCGCITVFVMFHVAFLSILPSMFGMILVLSFFDNK